MAASDPREGLFLPVASVRALYRCCHLEPPLMVVAGSAVEFSRAVVALARDTKLGLSACVLFLLPCLALAFAMVDLHAWLSDEVGERQALKATANAGIGVMAAWLVVFYFRLLAHPRPSVTGMALAHAGGALLGAAAGSVVGGTWWLIATSATIGAMLVVLAHVLLELIRPIRRRLIVRTLCGRRPPLLGSRPVHDLVSSRLRVASEEVPASSTQRSVERPRTRPPRTDRAAARLAAEGRRLADFRWHSLQPLLGEAAASGERLMLERVARRAADPDDLPAVLQAAIALNAGTDAASLLDRVAVILPKGVPIEREPELPALVRRLGLRSGRCPYREVFARLGDASFLQVLVDLAWSERIADRILARHVLRVEDRVTRYSLIQALASSA